MTLNTIKKVVLKFLAFLLFVPVLSNAQDDCFPKRPSSLVYDEAGILSGNQQQSLNNKLVQFDNSTSSQIVVVVVNDICGMDRAMYATELGQKWKVGKEGKDNGIVLLVKPTGGQSQRVTHIAVGYGLEGVIPDAIAKRIVENELIPHFKQNDFYGGINAAADVLMGLALGEFSAGDYNKRTKGIGPSKYLFILIIIFFVFISRIGGARSYARSNNTSFWLALLLMNSAMSSHRGHYGNFSSGGGSFGGGSSFGGFGGGSFGGGGAGGSW